MRERSLALLGIPRAYLLRLMASISSAVSEAGIRDARFFLGFLAAIILRQLFFLLLFPQYLLSLFARAYHWPLKTSLSAVKKSDFSTLLDALAQAAAKLKVRFTQVLGP